MFLKNDAMCCKSRRLLFTICFVFSFTAPLLAQQNGTGIKLFFEKLYLHTDRNYYASGDAIWFKAYLVNAQSNYPVSTSNTVYAELIDPANIIIAREVIRVDSGVGMGDFKLGDSIAGGSYRIRAYTSWMRNFGNYFVFEKQVEVKNIPGANKKEETVPVDTRQTAGGYAPGYSIHFFPEGGSMLQGINTLISFKAEDANGKGVDATGTVITSTGDTVAHFKTTYAGMGSFSFTAKANETYQALVQCGNHPATTNDFPLTLKQGYAMHAGIADTVAEVQVFANAATMLQHPSGEVTIAAKHGGRILYKEKLLLKDNLAIANFSTSAFPEGICSITVYDDSLHPQCERLLYIENKNALNISISTTKKTFAPKEKVTVKISVTDNNNQPVKINLSLAAIDDGIEKAGAENISTYLLLQSEVKGKIENPSAYFDKKNPQRFQQLDLLLRTQGWREFLWRKMADTTIAIHHMPEQGISISGKVTQKFSARPLPDMNITLQAPGAKGDKWYVTRTDAKGNYFLDGLPLYGVQNIKLSSKNDKAEKGGEIMMDSLFRNPLPVTAKDHYPYDTAAFSHFSKDAGKRFAVEKENKWYNILPGVTVTDKKKTVFMRDGAYLNFGYPEDNFTITSADYGYDDLRNFLGKKVPGAYYDMENDGVYFMANGKKIRPRFVVEKKEDVFDRIDYYAIPMQQISSISVKHMVGQPTFSRTEAEDGNIRDLGINNTDIFIVSLQLKPGAYNQDPAKIITEVSGYYQAKIFYSPNYAISDKALADQRTTIHWEPLITTNENGKASISFYNADPLTTIRLDVQGISSKGVLVAATATYDVK